VAGLCDGRICIVTGAGRGIGREHALALARAGATVVVNDVGSEMDGTGSSAGPAHAVVGEITGAGGVAVADGNDISDWDSGARRLIESTVDRFGRLDVLVNNAGILRDRTILKMNELEWDDVIRVHLKGTAATTHWATVHWAERFKQSGEVGGRLVNTTSASGIYGNFGQSDYGAAKAGIAGFTVIAALELERYGVTANAVSPGAYTRMTEGLSGVFGIRQPTEEQRDRLSPRWIAPIVVWLASTESAGVTGQVFVASGRSLGIAEGWRPGPTADPVEDPEAVGPIVTSLLEQAAPPTAFANRQGKRTRTT
jgi:NAD(P)-dependent dehydrogenase (short-subunit alcohol dehydrogenase family)